MTVPVKPNNGQIQIAKKFQHLNPVHNLNDSIQGGSFHRISPKNKNWKLVTGGESYTYVQPDGHPLPYIDVVILNINAHSSRLYFDGPYQEGSTKAPTCASLKGDVPDPGVPIPQNKTCHNCKQNQWPGGKRAKPCQETKRIAVLPLPNMKTNPPLPKPLTEPVFFKVTPGSLTPWKSYCNSLIARGAHYAAVITRISFEPDDLWKYKFDYLKSLTDKDADLILPLTNDPATLNILGSMQEFRPDAAPEKTIDMPEDTGFAEAFGGQAPQEEAQEGEVLPPEQPKRGPGRPPKPKPVAKAEEATEPAEEEESAFAEPKDASLDSIMQDVLGDKIGKGH
jgi:hypothetical protein